MMGRPATPARCRPLRTRGPRCRWRLGRRHAGERRGRRHGMLSCRSRHRGEGQGGWSGRGCRSPGATPQPAADRRGAALAGPGGRAVAGTGRPIAAARAQKENAWRGGQGRGLGDGVPVAGDRGRANEAPPAVGRYGGASGPARAPRPAATQTSLSGARGWGGGGAMRRPISGVGRCGHGCGGALRPSRRSLRAIPGRRVARLSVCPTSRIMGHTDGRRGPIPAAQGNNTAIARQRQICVSQCVSD